MNSTTSSLNIAVYDFLRIILSFSMGKFLGKFLNYKSLRLKEHTNLKMEAVSTSTESHYGVMQPKMEAIMWHVVCGKKRLPMREKFKGYLHWKVLVLQHDQVFSSRR
jgi:hypothetical protein